MLVGARGESEAVPESCAFRVLPDEGGVLGFGCGPVLRGIGLVGGGDSGVRSGGGLRIRCQWQQCGNAKNRE
jgi:hypothetical protein